MKVIRKTKAPDSKLVLEEVIGLTTKSANGLASSFLSSNCVYIAGCVVVVYNVNSGNQSHLIASHRMPKPLSCVAVSEDGRFVAAGESGHQPAVLIWESATLNFVSELRVHQYGIVCIAFSPDGGHLVSVGFPHDGYICLWDWRSGSLITKLKSTSSCSAVTSVCFSSDAKFIVTSGKKHLKFWSIKSSTRSISTTGTGLLAMHGKPANLGHQKGSSFVSVITLTCTDGSLVGYGSKQAKEPFPICAFTDSGILCLIDSQLSVQKLVDLKVKKGFALSASNKLIACACSNGIVQLITIGTLNCAGTLQYSSANRCQEVNDIACHTEVAKMELLHASTIPDAIACQFSASDKLVVVYGDCSLYIWDIRDVSKATRCCGLVSHSACIWDIKNLPCDNMHDPSLACAARGCSGGVSFATCSADGTIRLWDLVFQSDLSKDVSSNLSKEHHSVISGQEKTANLESAGIFERDTVETGVGTQGFRSMAVSSDGRYLAAGDCQGNLHIYNLRTSDYTCVRDAHHAEILSLSFGLPIKKAKSSENVMNAHYLLASGGRDRMINLYDVERNFELIESIDDHSAAVTSVKVICDGRKILSCSADRSLMFRDVATTDTGCKVLRRHHVLASHGTVYDMTVDNTREVVITVGQDKKINTFDVAAGKLIKSFKQHGDFGDPIKVSMDPSCSYLLCSYSNKSICMYDFISGELVTHAMGHGEVITGVIFLPDCKHIISVGGDGCIFVWKVPALLSSRMLQRMRDNSGPLSPASTAQPIALSQFIFQEADEHQCKPGRSKNVDGSVRRQGANPQETSAFKFSISRLPRWAQDKVAGSAIIPRNPDLGTIQQGDLNMSSPLLANGEGCTLLYPEVPTPSNLDFKESEQLISNMSGSSSDTADSKSSPTSQKTLGSFAVDKRWNTIHTICLDLLNSPQVWNSKDEKMQFPASNLLQDLTVEMPQNDEHRELSSRGHNFVNYFCANVPSGHVNYVVDDGRCVTSREHPDSQNYGSVDESNVRCEPPNASSCHDAVVNEVSEDLNSESQESEFQAITKIVSQDNDLFDQHFGNLSTALKPENKKSSASRRYSSRFTVRRDQIKGRHTLFNTSVQDVGDESLGCGAATLDDQPAPKPEKRKMMGSPEEDLKSSKRVLSPGCSLSSQGESTTFTVMEDPLIMEVIDARDQNQSVTEATEMQERITACKEALLCLDAAAERSLQLFSKLRTLVYPERKSDELESQLYYDAAELLPSIAEKVLAVANLVQSSKNNSNGNGNVEGSSLESFLGTVTQSLPHKLVEIPKKNLSN